MNYQWRKIHWKKLIQKMYKNAGKLWTQLCNTFQKYVPNTKVWIMHDKNEESEWYHELLSKNGLLE